MNRAQKMAELARAAQQKERKTILETQPQIKPVPKRPAECIGIVCEMKSTSSSLSGCSYVVEEKKAKQSYVGLNPIVPRTTEPYHTETEIHYEQRKLFLEPEAKLPSDNDPEDESNFEEVSDFDDSDTDPNFVLHDMNDHNNESNYDTDVEGMAKKIESAVACSSISKPSTSKKMIKTLRNLGKSYSTNNGKIVPERKLSLLGICRNKCATVITPDLQQKIFVDFWKMGDYSLRVLFAANLIEIGNTRTLKKHFDVGAGSSRLRRFSCRYYLTVDGEKKMVCKTCFTKTLGETNKFIRTIIEKKIEASALTFCPDMRGKHPPANKYSDAVTDVIKEHIRSFPAYELHYSRRDTAKLYLQGNLSISKMHKLYCDTQQSPVSIRKYAEIFKSMDLKFKPPKNDTCSRCDLLKAKIDSSQGEALIALKQEQKEHYELADSAYKAKDIDKTVAKTNKEVQLYTFDLQQCLPTPFLQNSVSFYKRQLWTYNLTVHDCETNTAYCYMWDETTAKRGGNDIGSCVYKHLLGLPSTYRNITFYSDSCPGQNKNSHIASMFITFLLQSENLETIDHKFLVVGHTHMECDVDHPVIERAKKRTEMKIHQPRDWYNFVRTVGKKQPFKVVEMQIEDFKNFAEISKKTFQWRKVDIDGNPFSWKSVRWLRYSKLGNVQFKEGLQEITPFRTLKMLRGKNLLNNIAEKVQSCYKKPLPITKEKMKDLLDLLPYIDPACHEFYKRIESIIGPNYHPDLATDDEEDV